MKEYQDHSKDIGQAGRIIKKQLTLHAILWDIGEDGLSWENFMEKIRAEKLKREIGCYQILGMQVTKQEGREPKERYRQIQARLDAAGIAEAEAVLVTEDAALADLVYAKRQTGAELRDMDLELPGRQGLAVIYYEKPGFRAEASADMIVQGFEEIGVQFMDRVQKRRNGLPWNILYTSRICVREITLDDMDGLFELYRGEGITDYTEPLYEREQEEVYTKNYITHMYYYYGYGMWVLIDRESGRLIGRAGIEHHEDNGRVLMELGYMIGKPYQGQGYATEACRGILEYAAEELQIEEMHCFIHPDNLPSVRVARKLGAVLRGEETGIRGRMLHYSIDLKEYS